MGKVVNIYLDPYDIYIGRKSIWGNPYTVKLSRVPGTQRVASSKDAIRLYEEWLRQQPELLKQLPNLRGKTLGCFCAPKGGVGIEKGTPLFCHGQILLKLIEEMENVKN
jgi:hypothetical protein